MIKSEIPFQSQTLFKVSPPHGSSSSNKTLLHLDHTTYDPLVFTFQPKISNTSLQIASQLESSFFERQEQHIKQRKKYEEDYQSLFTCGTRPSKIVVLGGNENLRPDVHFTRTRIIRKGTENNPKMNQNKLTSVSQTLTDQVKKYSRCLSEKTDNKQISEKKMIKSAKASNENQPLKENIRFKTASSPYKNKNIKMQDTSQLRKAKSHTFQYSTFINANDKLTRIKATINRAKREKTIFFIKGPYKILRKRLRSRGWIEINYHSRFLSPLEHKPSDKNKKISQEKNKTSGVNSDSDDCLTDDSFESQSSEMPSDEEEYCILSRAVQNELPSFIWTCKTSDVSFSTLKNSQSANHFHLTGCFTTKSGLCQTIQELPWYSDTDPSDIFPRCYLLSSPEDKIVFVQDFLQTAAISLIKLYLGSDNSSDVKEIVSRTSLDFALQMCIFLLNSLDHTDIDTTNPKSDLFSERNATWIHLLADYRHVLQKNAKFPTTSQTFYDEACSVIQNLKNLFPQYEMNGVRNIWILKPGAKSRGRGIKCLNSLDEILKNISAKVLLKEGKFVIQKYIENPLLIEGTKFDIRQWFLVTNWNPLTIWIYKECYIRFSGQLFTCTNLNESVHLCNNSVQKHYKISKLRSNALPHDNIWDLNTFSQYLKDTIGYDIWREKFYEQAKNIIHHVLFSCLENVVHHKGSFELFGADFMITSDLKLMLLEINSSPTMAESTEVTRRLCRQVQEDCIRLIVDRKRNIESDISNWDLINKGRKLDLRIHTFGGCLDFMVKGNAIRHTKF